MKPLCAVQNASEDKSRIASERAALASSRLKAVQSRLNTLGYHASVPDGLSGPSTESAIRNFKSQNGLPVDSTLTAAERNLLMSDNAKPALTKAVVSNQSDLLAKARASGSEYDQAHQAISEDLVAIVREKTKITLGNADVSQAADGSFNVRVPVSWSMPEQDVLPLLNRYFNGFDGKPLVLISLYSNSGKNRIEIKQMDVESSSAVKPYSGRLFKALQKVEINIEVSIGPKKSTLVIAGSAYCHVGCDYTEEQGNGWILQIWGKPRGSTISWNQETPVVIKGLTESDLQNFGSPVAVIR